MADAYRDQNNVPTLIAASNADGFTPVRLWADPTTHRLLVDLAGAGAGTVTSVSVVTANGFAGSVANATTTPAITLSTTITGVLKGNGTAISAAVAGTDYVAPGSATTSGLTMSTSRILGRTTALSGAIEEISVGSGLSLAAGSLSATGVAGSIVVGTTTITSGTTTRILYDNAGVLGEYTITGSGTVVAMQNTPTLTTPVINGTITGTGQATVATASTIAMRDANGNSAFVNSLEGYTTTATAAGTTTLTVSSNNMQYFTGSTTQTVVMPVTSTLVLGQSWWIVNLSTGAVTVNSSGGNTIVIVAAGTCAEITCILTSGTTAASWNATYMGTVITSGKKLSVSNTLTLAGTDSTTMTFPSTSATIARTDAAQTFTGTQTFSQVNLTANAITASGNAATVPITSGRNIVTNNSAATLTITMTTTSAVNMQTCIVQILDFSAVAQTITWVNTENSTVTAPTTSNGSTTLPLTVGFIYNAATSKWRCVASA